MQMLRLMSLLVLVFIMSSVVNAEQTNTKSIYDQRINWDNQSARTEMLAHVPQWQPEVIQTLFQAYKNPQQYKFQTLEKAWQQNLLFIHAFFGPLDNPFLKYARPAKLFVTFSETDRTTQDFILLPLIQDQQNHQYYVFDQSQTQPVLLNDWMITAKKSHSVIYVTVSTDYAAHLSDAVDEHDYQNEMKALLSNSNLFSAHPSSLFSAHRDESEDWLKKARQLNKLQASADENIYQSSIDWHDQATRATLLETTVAWPNYQVIQDHFIKMRDMRYFQDGEVTGFSRRITWLFPDDGCWTRAAAMIQDFFGPINNMTVALPRPSRVFAFGNLCVNSTNARNGSVSWWYHVAPLVKDAETNQEYVLDPSVNPLAPMKVEDWMATISSNSDQCSSGEHNVSQFNVCNGYGAGPFDSCAGSNYQNELSEINQQTWYRIYERQRQTELGRDANLVLGDMPPWNN